MTRGDGKVYGNQDGISEAIGTLRVTIVDDQRDRAAVLGTIVRAKRMHNGDPDGTVRTELLMALGLHDLALTMQAEAGLPAVINSGDRIAPEPFVRHGTVTAYERHITDGETPCKPNPAWRNRSRALAALTPDDPSLGGSK